MKHFLSLACATLLAALVGYVALAALAKDKAPMPELTHDALAQNYPVLYQSLLQVVHNTGERVNGIMAGRKDK